MADGNEVSREIVALRRSLLAWYARHRRDLPWRRTRDPYAIWVSEIMLQQTRAAAVVERYTAFLKRFPTASSLAKADEQHVLAAWSGLGYYRRARMLHRAAQFVTAHRQGRLPQDSCALRELPGIGAYTAAAIASIAYNECVAAMDGNVERVLFRLQGWGEASGRAAGVIRRRMEALAAALIDPARPGDWNQAMMELGATVCLPRNPLCAVCPLVSACKTRGEHKTLLRPPRARREIVHALVVRTRRPSSATGRSSNSPVLEVLLEQRPAAISVMPGMWELPMLSGSAVATANPAITVRHAIMQINYVVKICAVPPRDAGKLTTKSGRRRWVGIDEARKMALTGLARKVLRRAQTNRSVLHG